MSELLLFDEMGEQDSTQFLVIELKWCEIVLYLFFSLQNRSKLRGERREDKRDERERKHM